MNAAGAVAVEVCRGRAPSLGIDDTAELDAAHYREVEVRLTGTAAGEPYVTRALLRFPADPTRFNGLLAIEPLHWAGMRPAWRASRRHLLARGHAWAQIASQATAPDVLQRADADRYADVSIVDAAAGDAPPASDIGAGRPARRYADVVRDSDAFRRRWLRASVQSPGIIADFAHAARTGRTPLPAVRHIVLAGLSQTGGVVRAFAADHHARFSTGHPVFDGYLAMSSGGDAVADLDVPVMELLGESELEEVRRAHLLPGQVRGFSHRRPDSPSFRLYEAAGMGHVDSRDDLPASPPPAGTLWSGYPNAHAVHFAWDALTRWVVDGVPPPPGRHIETDAGGAIVRDRWGHARGGLRSPHLDVPVAAVTPIAGSGPEWTHGAQRPFGRGELEHLYGTVSHYRDLVRADLEELVAAGYYLPGDAADYLAHAQWPTGGGR